MAAGCALLFSHWILTTLKGWAVRSSGLRMAWPLQPAPKVNRLVSCSCMFKPLQRQHVSTTAWATLAHAARATMRDHRICICARKQSWSVFGSVGKEG